MSLGDEVTIVARMVLDAEKVVKQLEAINEKDLKDFRRLLELKQDAVDQFGKQEAASIIRTNKVIENEQKRRADMIARINRDVTSQFEDQQRQQERSANASVDRQLQHMKDVERQKINAILATARQSADIQYAIANRVAPSPGVTPGFGSGVSSALMMGGAAGIGFAAASMGINAVRNAISDASTEIIEFNRSLAQMSTFMDLNGDSASKLSERIVKLGEEAGKISAAFNIEISEVVGGFKEALSSGILEKDLVKFTNISATLATALTIDLEDAGDILTTFKDSYHLTVDELATVSSKLFKTVDVGRVSIEQLVTNLPRLVPIAAAAKISVDEMFASIAGFTRGGMTTSVAVTSLTQLIKGIEAPTDKAIKEFDRLHIAYGEAAVAAKGLDGVMREIIETTGGGYEALAKLFPEDRMLRGATMYKNLIKLINEAGQEIIKSESDDVKASALAQDTFWDNWAKSRKKSWNELVEVGNKLSNVLNSIFYGDKDADKKQAAFNQRFDDAIKFSQANPFDPTTMDRGGYEFEMMNDPFGRVEKARHEKAIDDRIILINNSVNKVIEEEKMAAEREANNALLAAHEAGKVQERIEENFKDVATRLQKSHLEFLDKLIFDRSKKVHDLLAAGYSEDDVKPFRTQLDSATGQRADLINSVKQEDELSRMLSEMREKDAREQEKRAKEKERAAKTLNDSIINIMKDMYNHDISEFEKTEKAKLKLAERYNNQQIKLAENRIKEIENIAQRIHDAQAMGLSPDRQRRMAMADREQSVDKFKQYAGGGNIDEKILTTLLHVAQQALDKETGLHPDDRRAGRNKAEIDTQLGDIFQQALLRVDAQNKSKFDKGMNSLNYVPRTPEEIAQQATQKALAKKEATVDTVKQILDANIHVDINGEISKDGAQKLLNIIAPELQRMIKNGNLNPKAPPQNFDDASEPEPANASGD